MALITAGRAGGMRGGAGRQRRLVADGTFGQSRFSGRAAGDHSGLHDRRGAGANASRHLPPSDASQPATHQREALHAASRLIIRYPGAPD